MGGYVMPAASELNSVVTNGMSYYSRDGVNANSALLVGVQPSDFAGDSPLARAVSCRQYAKVAVDSHLAALGLRLNSPQLAVL